MSKPNAQDKDLEEAFGRHEETLCMIAAVVAQQDVTLTHLQAVSQRSSMAMEALEDVLREVMRDAWDYYAFREQARECCAWEHWLQPFAQAYLSHRQRFWDAHGDLYAKYFEITGEDPNAP